MILEKLMKHQQKVYKDRIYRLRSTNLAYPRAMFGDDGVFHRDRDSRFFATFPNTCLSCRIEYDAGGANILANRP